MEVEAPFKSLAVANRFIELGKESGGISLMKLLKIIYFAHGWHLALMDNKPLIDDTIEAWKFGPVAPTVYHSLKQNGSDPITALAVELDRKSLIENKVLNFLTPALEREDYPDNFILKIWEIYGKMTAFQLSELTHQTGTPWYKIWHDEGGSQRKGADIPDSIIANYFKSKLSPVNEQESAVSA
jgi:uncharacterized phage-associated protein